jgi:hypothetical protein
MDKNPQIARYAFIATCICSFAKDEIGSRFTKLLILKNIAPKNAAGYANKKRY